MHAIDAFAQAHFADATLRWFPEAPAPGCPAALAALFTARGRPDLKRGKQRVLSIWAPARWKPVEVSGFRPWEDLTPATLSLVRVGEVALGGGLPKAWLCYDPARDRLCRMPRHETYGECIYGDAADIAGLVADLTLALSARDPQP